MHCYILLYILAAALLVWAQDPNDMMQFRMAVLNKNGEQTTCMVAIMNMVAGFVAANCIDLYSDNTVNITTTYKVQFTPTGQYSSGFEVDLDTKNITIHPYYDAQSLANNIAIVQYTNTSDTYKAYIGQQKSSKSTQVYTRRGINGTTDKWGDPVVFDQLSDDGNCTAGSPLYAANQSWLSCTDTVTTSLEDQQCSMPYGITYTMNNTDGAVFTSNIFSHSVVYGDSLCDGSVKTLSYYTSLWSYLGFAYSVVGWPISVYYEGGTTLWENDSVGSMNPPGDTSVSGTVIVGGDLYMIERAMAGGSYDTSGIESESATATDGSSQTPTNSSGGGGGSSGGDGLSKGTKIAIGIAVPMSVIIIAIGTAILIHIWKASQQDKAWDPSAQALNLQEVALEMTVEVPLSLPPPYTANEEARGSRFKEAEEPVIEKKD